MGATGGPSCPPRPQPPPPRLASPHLAAGCVRQVPLPWLDSSGSPSPRPPRLRSPLLLHWPPHRRRATGWGSGQKGPCAFKASRLAIPGSERGEPCGSGLEGVYPGQRGEEGTGPERPGGSNGAAEAAARGGCAVNRVAGGPGGGVGEGPARQAARLLPTGRADGPGVPRLGPGTGR